MQEVLFHWDELEQNLILGAYFWPHWIFQLPGGILAYYYSPKYMVAFNNLACAILTFLIPLAASYGFQFIFTLRALQGLIAVSIYENHEYDMS